MRTDQRLHPHYLPHFLPWRFLTSLDPLPQLGRMEDLGPPTAVMGMHLPPSQRSRLFVGIHCCFFWYQRDCRLAYLNQNSCLLLGAEGLHRQLQRSELPPEGGMEDLMIGFERKLTIVVGENIKCNITTQ